METPNALTQIDMINTIEKYIKDVDTSWDELIKDIKDKYNFKSKRSMLYKAYDIASGYYE